MSSDYPQKWNRQGLHAFLSDKLAKFQLERSSRPEVVEDPAWSKPGSFHSILEWALFERESMHKEVNRLRAFLNLPPIAMAEIVKVEQQAVGHSDYSPKFALYCAELVNKH